MLLVRPIRLLVALGVIGAQAAGGRAGGPPIISLTGATLTDLGLSPKQAGDDRRRT
jgi:hypothetical protein